MSTTTEAEKKMSTQEKTRSGVSHIEKNTQEDVGNTLGRAENIKKDFEKKYGKKPSQEEVFTTLKGSDTFKDCKTFDDAMRILKEGLDPKKDDTSGKNPDLYNWLKANALSKDTIEQESEGRDFAKVYGEHPTQAHVLKILKERQPDTYGKCKTYEDAMKIVKLRRAPLHKRLEEHVIGDNAQKEIDEMLGEVGLKEAGYTDSGYTEADKKRGGSTEEAHRKKIEEKVRKDLEKERKKTEEELMENLKKKGEELHKDELKEFAKIEKEAKATAEKDAEKSNKKEKKSKNKKEKKDRKRDRNVFNGMRFTATSLVSRLGGMIPRAVAKTSATIARPQDLTHPKYWIDIGKNWLKSRPDKIKIFTGFFWKPHRKPTQFANVYKGYRPTRGLDATGKHRKTKNFFRTIGKVGVPAAATAGLGLGFTAPAKVGANLTRGTSHFIHESLENIKRAERHRNPKHRSLKWIRYPKTVEAFKRTFSWDRKPDEMVGDKK